MCDCQESKYRTVPVIRTFNQKCRIWCRGYTAMGKISTEFEVSTWFRLATNGTDRQTAAIINAVRLEGGPCNK